MHETPNRWFPRLTATSTIGVTVQRRHETSLRVSNAQIAVIPDGAGERVKSTCSVRRRENPEALPSDTGKEA
jgi:hypothetical protein